MNQSNTIEEPYTGQKFTSFDALKKYLVDYSEKNYFKFWIRSSHTTNSLKGQKMPLKARKMNPDLKYVSVKFACIFGGEKIRCRGSGIRKSSTFRNLGCQCMIKAIVGDDGNHVILSNVLLQHNHPLCKTLYDSLKKTKRKGKSGKEENEDSVVLNNEINYTAEVWQNEMQEGSNENNDTVLVENLKKNVESESYLENIKDRFGGNVEIVVIKSENEKKRELKNEETDDEADDTKDLFELTENICRLCLSAKDKLSPIFNPELPLKSTVLSFKIMGCASIEITSDDGLPNSICKTCEHNLDIAYNFRLTCENSDSILRKAYTKQNNTFHPTILNVEKSEKEAPGEELQPHEIMTCPEITEDKNEIIPVETPNQDFLYIQVAVPCPVCESNFETYETMLEHLRSHADNEALLLSCNICNAIVPSMKELQQHMTNHLEEMKLEMAKCEKCDCVFESKKELKKHERTHKKEEVKYLCNVCGKTMKTRDRFESHKNSHEGLRPHICTKCGRGFADKKNLYQHHNIVHLRRVTEECPVCHKKFYARTKMKSHLTMHYGVKPFSCDLCDKTFRLKMNMVKHKKTHLKERPFKCDQCTSTFVDRNMLKRHSFVHGGIRPYSCHICGHRFGVKCLLKKHLQKSKCALAVVVGGEELKEDEQIIYDEWVRMEEPDTNLPEEECRIVAVNDENVLNTDSEGITMSILPECGS